MENKIIPNQKFPPFAEKNYRNRKSLSRPSQPMAAISKDNRDCSIPQQITVSCINRVCERQKYRKNNISTHIKRNTLWIEKGEHEEKKKTQCDCVCGENRKGKRKKEIFLIIFPK